MRYSENETTASMSWRANMLISTQVIAFFGWDLNNVRRVDDNERQFAVQSEKSNYLLSWRHNFAKWLKVFVVGWITGKLNGSVNDNSRIGSGTAGAFLSGGESRVESP